MINDEEFDHIMGEIAEAMNGILERIKEIRTIQRKQRGEEE